MKISFYQQGAPETDNIGSTRTHTAEHGAAAQVPQDSYFAENSREWTEMNGKAGKGKSLIELQQEAGNVDMGVGRDYMILMSNTMSEEDYARMQEEGFDFREMDPEEAVTIVDKIKAELVRSGKSIEGYTDDLDMDTLAAALGSDVLAQAVAVSFQKMDLPLTAENLESLSRAWAMTQQLQSVDEGSIRYLIDNGMDPEIWNLYLAQSSGAGTAGGGTARFYAEDIQGYYARSAGADAGAEFQKQIDRIIEQSGRNPDEETRKDAAWLLEKGLPLTEENLRRMEELKKIEIPVTEKRFGEAAAAAVADGKDPVHALLAEGENRSENLYEKAVRLEEYYHSNEIWEKTAEDLAARRQLEEVRLRMTAEVNIRLLKSGFAIDTEPMERLVEALKQAEKQLAEQYFPEDEGAVEKYRSLHAAESVIGEIPGLPARILGVFAQGEGPVLEEFHSQGKALQETYAKAGESYEALMTSPRKDMGDSIRKAFANVDDILKDLGMEPSEENRRAVRILGYNRMEINPENLNAVMEADRQVQTVIEKLTPAATLKMIRDGVNPLEKSFEELEEYFDELPEEYSREAGDYSRFLYGLEKNRSITEEERESYIGIYRLVRQIEKSDGAVVGALVNTQAQLHFSNLLSAVRSGKVKSLDMKVADRLETVVETLKKGESISDQIYRAFTVDAGKALTEVSYSEEAVEEYNREQLDEARDAAARADEECMSMLQRGQIPASADHMIAAHALAHETEDIFAGTQAKRKEEQKATGVTEKNEVTDVSEKQEEGSLQSLQQGGKGTVSGTRLWELLDSGAEFEEKYAEAVNQALLSTERESLESAGTSLDVRKMQLVCKQLTIAGDLAKQQEFFIPMYIGETLTRVHLTLQSKEDRKGIVDISVQYSEGRIHGQFGLENGTLQGIFTAQDKNEVMKLQKIADTFRKEAENSWTVDNISVVTTDVRAAAGYAAAEGSTDSSELYRVAKIFLQAVQQGENDQ